MIDKCVFFSVKDLNFSYKQKQGFQKGIGYFGHGKEEIFYFTIESDAWEVEGKDVEKLTDAMEEMKNSMSDFDLVQ